MKRALIIATLVLATAAAFGTAAAQANTYCANSTDPACATNYTNMATAVQSAVADAKSNPGPDTVLIGPGSFTSPTPMALYGSGTGNTVTIIGSGSGTDPSSNSVLSVSDQENPNITFDAGDGSSMSNLSFFIDASATATVKEGLVVRNSFDGTPPTVSNVTIYSNPNPRNVYAVVLYSGSNLEDSSVDVSSANYFTAAVKADGGNPSTVSRSYLAGNNGAVQNSTNGELVLDRVEIRANGKGVMNATGRVWIDDSLIVTADGAQVAIDNQGGNTVSGDVNVDGSTIIANSGSGISVRAEQGTSNARLFFDNSVLAGSNGTIEAITQNAGDTVTLNADSAAYDTTRYSASGSGTENYDPQDVINLAVTSPGFANAGAGDFRLAPGSALIDAGQPVDPPAGALDLEGNPRACRGTSAGVIRRDLGAFEHKVDPGDDCTYPQAGVDPSAGTFNDLTPTFTLTSSKAGNEFLCSIDEAAYVACGPSYTTPALTAGAHTLDVRAKDTFGNIQPNPVRASFTVTAPTCQTDSSLCPPPNCATDPSLCPPPTCATDPSLCPKPDKTAPKVIGLKAPKRTRAARVKVRFRANEAGVTFTCKLNGAKAKRCRSPWKTPRLRKGRNTIAIQATDKAGNRSKVVKRVISRVVKRKTKR